ncbi:MAG: RagB/SusD family nutrient uptake outer membrane protein [Bacteroidales bacterium]|nr:RagB/SusD family nutrient uptake outer membrane protein [Candidatus Cryptobacteroides onthequi]
MFVRNIKLAAASVLCIAALSSCEEFLTEYPSESVTSLTAINTPSDVKTALNGVYNKMTSVYYYGRQFLFYADYKGSDLTVFSLGRGDSDFFAFQHEENNNAHENFWRYIYNDILQVSNIIERASELGELSSSEQTALNDYVGQAYALRGLFHFDLVRLYGYPYLKDNGASLGVPIITTVLSADAQPTRATVAEVYAQCIKDLETALPLLSKSKTNGMINYYGAVGELARICLYKGDYANALKYAREIINSGVYTVYEPSKWAASWKSQYGSESIFELYVSAEDGTDQAKSSPRWYTLAKGQGEGASGCWLASEAFLDRMSEDETDVRWEIMKPDECALCGLGGVNVAPYYIPGRRGSIMKYDGDGKTPATATNIKVMRLSEIYLIAAEAALATNDKGAAVSYLNEIRRRSPKLAPATVDNISVDMILSERSKELVLEGHRYFDQLRLGRTIVFDDTTLGTKAGLMDYVLTPPDSRSTTVDWNYYRCVLPISLDERNANPGIQQNPEY